MKIKTSLCVLFLSSLVCLQANAQPITSAPTPPARDASKVISLYSDAYTNVAVGYCENWGQTTSLTANAVGTDNYLYYQNFNYLGWALTTPANAVSMTHLHIDIWSPTNGSIGIVPIYGGTGLATDDSHRKIVSLTANQWNSFDLELSSEYSGLDLSSIFQVKFDTGTDVTNFAIDNFYFYNSSTTVDAEKPTALSASFVSASYFSVVLACSATDNSGAVNFTITNGVDTVAKGGAVSGATANIVVNELTPATDYTLTVSASDADGNICDTTVPVSASTLAIPAAAPTPTNAAADVISLYSDAYTTAASWIFGGWGQSTVDSEVTLAAGDHAKLYTGFNYVGWEINGNAAAFDASEMNYLHVDVYSPNMTQFQITPIWGGEALYTCTPLEQNQWNSFDIPLTSTYTGINLANIYQIKMVAQPTSSAVAFIDNVYFAKSAGTAINEAASVKKLNMTTENGMLIIEGAENQSLAVYSVLGKCMFATDKAADKVQLTLPNGMYMVTSNNQTQKIIIR